MTGEQTGAPRRGGWTFARHYLEMVAAMLIGMVTLYPLWLLVGGGGHRTEIDLLAMATAMTVPMVAWMAHHGHRARVTAEMTAAMYAGFIVLFPFLWMGGLDEMGLMMIGHVLMPVFMLGAMFARRSEYTVQHVAAPGSPGGGRRSEGCIFSE